MTFFALDPAVVRRPPGKTTWLKSGAADETGQGLEDAWAAKTKDRHGPAMCGATKNGITEVVNNMLGKCQQHQT